LDKKRTEIQGDVQADEMTEELLHFWNEIQAREAGAAVYFFLLHKCMESLKWARRTARV
jgi:hypothetical protein